MSELAEALGQSRQSLGANLKTLESCQATERLGQSCQTVHSDHQRTGSGHLSGDVYVGRCADITDDEPPELRPPTEGGRQGCDLVVGYVETAELRQLTEGFGQVSQVVERNVEALEMSQAAECLWEVRQVAVSRVEHSELAQLAKGLGQGREAVVGDLQDLEPRQSADRSRQLGQPKKIEVQLGRLGLPRPLNPLFGDFLRALLAVIFAAGRPCGSLPGSHARHLPSAAASNPARNRPPHPLALTAVSAAKPIWSDTFGEAFDFRVRGARWLGGVSGQRSCCPPGRPAAPEQRSCRATPTDGRTQPPVSRRC